MNFRENVDGEAMHRRAIAFAKPFAYPANSIFCLVPCRWSRQQPDAKNTFRYRKKPLPRSPSASTVRSKSHMLVGVTALGSHTKPVACLQYSNGCLTRFR